MCVCVFRNVERLSPSDLFKDCCEMGLRSNLWFDRRCVRHYVFCSTCL